MRLTYSPKGATTHLALVGKGITFDSGGLSIKPGGSMTTMKCDMAGAAAVVAATFAIAELELPVRVTTVVPMAENMVSGAATRPGDVLTMYGGRTVEVLNTDAEGRLVLADGLVLATEAEPDVLLDVATLTGACEVALGDRVAGIMGNDDALVEQTIGAGARAGEMLWQLPISAEMPVKVTTYSKIADLMQHNVDTYGGALYAAAFLQEFVGETGGRTSTSPDPASTAGRRTVTSPAAAPEPRSPPWSSSPPSSPPDRASPAQVAAHPRALPCAPSPDIGCFSVTPGSRFVTVVGGVSTGMT